MGKPSEEIIFRGYARKEDDHWFAICIDLNIAAQGEDPEEAIKTCTELIIEYLEFVCQEYPGQIKKYIPRPAPQEFFEEYYSFISLSITKPARRRQSKKLWNYPAHSGQIAHCGA